jgi:formylglycine-generating enzyme required for sulfatase activity
LQQTAGKVHLSSTLNPKTRPPSDFPDDPSKWDGWSNYKAENPYERLCFDAKAKPSDEQIQERSTALMRWWQKKLPLKNQPSNPVARLLGRGLDEASSYLVEARMQLLDPARRHQIDEELAAQAQREAMAEFSKYVAVSIAGRVLTPEAEALVSEFGQRNGLTEDQIRACIDEELRRNEAKRGVRAPLAAPPTPPPSRTIGTPEQEFHRILTLSNLNLADATPLVREIFVTIGENLGIRLERAEHLLEHYLDHEESGGGSSPAPRPQIQVQARISKAAPVAAAETPAPPPRMQMPPGKIIPSRLPAGYINPSGSQMMLIPGGEFVMGSDAPDSGPDEQPLTPVTLSEFYISRFPVTNAEYEQFDPSHRQKRMNGAGDNHPVVSVTSLEAIKYCQWLGEKDWKNYRLPTEAEWEYAARGIDGRKYPWGTHDRRGGFANYADASTSFAWRDPQVNDGYPETSPVGAFPGGASFFGIEDMAGNVWEWCLDFYKPLSGSPTRNPRGTSSGAKRVYRGGSWKSRFSNLRATARSSNAANYSCNDVGFRVVCECGSNDPE